MTDTPIQISEFRRNTKVFLDTTKTNDVWLRRGDDLFRVQYMGTVFDKNLKVGGTPVENTPTPKNTEVENLLKNNSEANTSGVSSSGSTSASELACCANVTQPCRHWVWDTSTGDGYRNTLSGRFLEVE